MHKYNNTNNNNNHSNLNKQYKTNDDISIIYDAECKNIISDKYVIANIVKDCIEEYHDLTIEEIIPLIDDGDTSNRYIKGISLVNYGIAEGTVDFDSLFTIKELSSSSRIGVIVNIEAQNSSYLKYNLLNRSEYYASWLIVCQKKYDLFNVDYSDLKKVYSIWLNIYPKKDKVDTIDYYALLNKNNLKEEVNSHINIIHYNVGKSYKYDLEAKQNVLEMLDILFHPNKEKIEHTTKVLEKKYHIIKRKEEVLNMCSLSKEIEYQGIQQGLQQGITSATVDNAISFINAGLSLENVFKILNLSDELKNKVLEKLNKN